MDAEGSTPDKTVTEEVRLGLEPQNASCYSDGFMLDKS